ncbi:sensor domain-containing diguanylate cyclase [Vibrio vulnificus]|nr:sensor domain-containing diguanylate cyclase [Vibrio vulnificus]
MMKKPVFIILLLSLIGLFSVSSIAQIQELKTLRVANSKAWKPFSYIAEDGMPRGILIDLWKLYGEKNGVDIEFVLLDWSDSLQAVEDGRADVHAGMLWSEPRDKRFDFASPIMTINTQLYLSQRIITTDLNYFLTGDGNRGVGVVEGGYEEYFVEKSFPKLPIVRFKNNRLMMEAAFREEIDAFVADLQVANFYLYTTAQSVAFIPALYLYSGEIRPAVAQGNAFLETIDQGFKTIGKEEIEKTINSWITIQTVYPKFLIPSVIATLALLSIIYIIILKRTVKARTHDLEVANKNLLLLSQQDYLTQISNRRHFMTQLRQLLPGDYSVSVLVFDIDDFKKINDSYGHAAGDVVIQSVAKRVSTLLPERALYARVGGEEFAIVARNLDFHDATALAQQICKSVAALEFIDIPECVTISLGCAYYPELKSAIDLGVADKLMYQAKNSGKNQACSEKVSP